MPNMFPSCNGRIKLQLLLLLALTQSFVMASVVENKKNAEASAKAFLISSMQVPWIDAIDSVMSSSQSSCAKETTALSAAINAQEMWALEMLDSSSKMQSGILQGNVIDLGMYGQCVAVDGTYNGVNVRGKHCMVTLSFEALKFTSSVCIPSSCNETQALQIASYVIKNLSRNSSLATGIKATTATCARVGSEDFSVGEILTIVFFSAVGCFILLCTFCDLLKRIQPEKTSSPDALNTLAKFSLYTNALAILSTEVKPGTIPVLNGIRFASICWIVALHHYAILRLMKPLVNLSDLLLLISKIHKYDIRRVSTTVLCLYISLMHEHTQAQQHDNHLPLVEQHMERHVASDRDVWDRHLFSNQWIFDKLRIFQNCAEGKEVQFAYDVSSSLYQDYPNSVFLPLHRLTPCVAVVMLFVAVLLHRIGNGPLWKDVGLYTVDNCKENWWYNFLYIQNILSEADICLMQSWFLAADMQLFLISPIILYPLHRWPKYGLGLCCLFLIASVVTPAVVVGLNGYTIIGSSSVQSFDNYYIRAYTRAFPYLLGILLGFDIATEKRHLTQRTAVFGWIVTCILLTLSCLVMGHLRNPNIEYNLAIHITCAALLRPCWSIAMAWIIYACIHGYGGIIGRFLESPIFLPLNRVSYGIYLVHLCITCAVVGTSAVPGIFTNSELFNSYLGIMLLSIAVSGLISLFFEMPVLVLEKILRGDNRKREPASHLRSVELKTENASQSQPTTGM